KTPTLILHGEDDPRIPISQSKELFRALKIHSDAPVRFVIYAGEGHGNRKNVHRFDYLLRTLDWFEYYLIDKPGASEKPPKYYDYIEE
ncbi:MAG: prolyl oligopeptidase family serine peptidase, partial [Bacteroidales bacterium]